MNIFLAEIHDDSTRTLQEERVYLYTEKIAAAYGFCVAAIFFCIYRKVHVLSCTSDKKCSFSITLNLSPYAHSPGKIRCSTFVKFMHKTLIILCLFSMVG